MNTCQAHDDGSVVVFTQRSCPLCESFSLVESTAREYEDKIENLEIDIESLHNALDDYKLQVQDLENQIEKAEAVTPLKEMA